MLVNVSRIQDHLRCGEYQHNRHRMKRSSARASLSLHFGKVWHTAMESIFDAAKDNVAPHYGEIVSLARDQLLTPESGAKWTEDDEKKLGPLMMLLERTLPQVTIPTDWKILEIEEELQMDWPTSGEPVTFRGRPDSVIQWNNKYWHVQHKTAAASTSWPLYEAAVARSFHEALYGEMLAQSFGQAHFGGTILLGVRKLGVKALEANPAEALHRAYIPIPRESRVLALASMARVAQAIHVEDVLFENDVPFHPIENRDSCYGTFKNNPCPYLAHCSLGADLMDDAWFVDSDPLEGYGEPAE